MSVFLPRLVAPFSQTNKKQEKYQNKHISVSGAKPLPAEFAYMRWHGSYTASQVRSTPVATPTASGDFPYWLYTDRPLGFFLIGRLWANQRNVSSSRGRPVVLSTLNNWVARVGQCSCLQRSYRRRQACIVPSLQTVADCWMSPTVWTSSVLKM